MKKRKTVIKAVKEASIWYLVIDICLIMLLIGFIFWLGFEVGKAYTKKNGIDLWKECRELKGSWTPTKRVGNVYISWQGAIEKANCKILWQEDFCTVHKFE
jgi:hypothetical protein